MTLQSGWHEGLSAKSEQVALANLQDLANIPEESIPSVIALFEQSQKAGNWSVHTALCIAELTALNYMGQGKEADDSRILAYGEQVESIKKSERTFGST